MSRPRLAGFAGVLTLLWVTVPASEARQREMRAPKVLRLAAAAPDVLPLEADRELLRRTMAQTRVATGRPTPGLMSWASDAGLAFSRWMAGWMERVLPGFSRRLAPLLEPAMMVLLALLAAALCVFLARYALERWRRRTRPVGQEPVEQLGPTTGPPATHDWAGELERRLGRGDVALAIEALWWWLASGLVADRAEPSWTSRELVTRAGRRDLLAAVRRLDRMMYGAARPQADEVHRLWSDLREAVG